ncbi:MAG: RNA methyltransferase [Planctomycetaceae bacterium]|nr:RNA methyltransferase [Planctomycetaceae bacterium]
MFISSLQNPRIKEIVQLRQGRKRRQSGKFLIDGRREVYRAFACGFPILEVFFAPDLTDEETFEWMKEFEDENQAEIAIHEVSPAVFAKIAYGDREDGVLAVAKYQEKTLDDAFFKLISQKQTPLIGIIEGVEKPGNIGAILRSADGAGLSALIIANPQTDLFNPNTIRASLGTIFSIPICADSSENVIAWLKKHQILTYAAIVDGAIHYTKSDFTKPCAIALGSEAWGLSETFRGEGIQPIFLPMRGIADSLNVSTTAAVLFYEALRQRTMEKDNFPS